MSSPVQSTAIVRLARRLRLLMTAFVIGIGAMIFWSAGVGLLMGPASVDLVDWSELVPPLVYLGGLWQLRGAFSAVASGVLFAPALEWSLVRLGGAMMAGATLQVVVIPNMLFWILGPGRGGALLRLDVAALSVGAIGAGLLLFARLIAAGRMMAAELDEMF